MKKHALIVFFVMTFAIIWGLAALFFLLPGVVTAVFGPISVQNPLFILAAWAPSLSAFIVTAGAEGKSGVVNLLKRFLPGRVNIIWYPAIILGPTLCGILISLIFGIPIVLFNTGLRPLFVFLFINLITGPLGEEFGWRGFALPRMLKRFSPPVASLLLGIIWGLWHLPSFFISGLPQNSLQLPLFLLSSLSFAWVITWVFIHTRGSIFFSFLLHYSVNFSLNMIGAPFLHVTLLWTGIALVLLLIYSVQRSGEARSELGRLEIQGNSAIDDR